MLEEEQPLGHPRGVYVWDLFVRSFHWVLVAAFFIAYLMAEEAFSIHLWAGYLIAGLIALRVIWGFVGPEHARFKDFIYRPKETLRYLRDLLLLRPARHRYVGHSPAGGVMIFALLASLVITLATGLVSYGADRHAGPLAGLFPETATVATEASTPPVPVNREQREHEGSIWREAHDLFANLTMALVFLHLGAVLFASYAHRENLILSMLTGYKRD
jgi:cytochrome b